MAEDDFPTRLAAYTGDDADGGEGLPSPSAVVAGLLAPLRGADKSPGGKRFDVAETSHADKRYAFACPVELAGTDCTARLVVRREDGYVYAKHGVHPPESGGLLSRVRGPSTGYTALDVNSDRVAALAKRRRKVVADGTDSRVVTPRLTDDPVGFELRFETAETAVLSVTGYSDGTDYLGVALPDLALRAVATERAVLD
ncbi:MULTISPECIES: hypothetical protein [Halobacterium]|uniref:hypothetical protein n=1 Tax=Halobacterium TaxID=2239 RepID=UPI00073F75A9|nr:MULTISPECIES: hypothetical protein [Halobacterium]MCG1004193.1 hypothetical protein [Halobacterium noricense]